jgi:hypothetical protein
VTNAKLLTAATDVATKTTGQIFRGSDHDVDVSFFLNHTAPGRGPDPHRTPPPDEPLQLADVPPLLPATRQETTDK